MKSTIKMVFVKWEIRNEKCVGTNCVRSMHIYRFGRSAIQFNTATVFTYTLPVAGSVQLCKRATTTTTMTTKATPQIRKTTNDKFHTIRARWLNIKWIKELHGRICLEWPMNNEPNRPKWCIRWFEWKKKIPNYEKNNKFEYSLNDSNSHAT